MLMISNSDCGPEISVNRLLDSEMLVTEKCADEHPQRICGLFVI